MEKNNYIWIKEGYLGHDILSTNYSDYCCKVTFGGARRLDNSDKWKIHLIYSNASNSNKSENKAVYSSTISLVITPKEKIRFESYLGITEKISIKDSTEEPMTLTRFFPVQYIRFLYIEQDYIKYEAHCY